VLQMREEPRGHVSVVHGAVRLQDEVLAQMAEPIDVAVEARQERDELQLGRLRLKDVDEHAAVEQVPLHPTCRTPSQLCGQRTAAAS